MGRNGVLESIVGIFVIVIAGVFFFYAYSVSGKTLGANSYEVNALFGRVDGVTVGSEIRIAGVKVGSVSGLELKPQDYYQAEVRMTINKTIPIPDDSIAKIVSDGLLGGAHIALEPGASEEYLIDGDTIPITQGSVDLLGIAVQSFTANVGNNSAGSDTHADQTGNKNE